MLVPKYSDIKSRSEIDISVDLGKTLQLEFPILASPMDTISETQMAIALDKVGGAAVIHRYNSIDEQAEIIAKAVKKLKDNVGAAVGITGDYLERATAAFNAGATFICVDVAHGHHAMMKTALQRLRVMLGNDYHIMAGNVATLQGVTDLADWGTQILIECLISEAAPVVRLSHPNEYTVFLGCRLFIDCAQTDKDVKLL